ncbi:MAG TPA: xanthine dehydrogenase accessory protein XdhC [Salibaculum sp.]|nr:xanthine dehydrogenase accessory protein XdhC [Salibaculum sp.]HKL68237.1 xanthine dehydrogenase accessory protein XdhC [Salibaculum sp.]
MIRVRVASTAGSAPRDAGTEMLVGPDGIEGTIGGGALEWQAISTARRMIRENRQTHRETMPLGPALGQCCGGSVVLDFASADTLPAPAGRPLWIWGAGHVGRALAGVFGPLPDFAPTLIDVSTHRFPETLPGNVTPVVAADPARLVPHAPAQADHLIVTYSHDLDLKLCHALLGHGFASCGLIGSATKWARFRSRLAALGHSDAQISRIACPIGDPGLGKHPQAIAVGTAAGLLSAPGRNTAQGDGTG